MEPQRKHGHVRCEITFVLYKANHEPLNIFCNDSLTSIERGTYFVNTERGCVFKHLAQPNVNSVYFSNVFTGEYRSQNITIFLFIWTSQPIILYCIMIRKRRTGKQFASYTETLSNFDFTKKLTNLEPSKKTLWLKRNDKHFRDKFSWSIFVIFITLVILLSKFKNLTFPNLSIFFLKV